MSEVSVFDVAVVAVILISAVFAMWRGLVQETFSILEWVAGAFVALRFAPTFQPLVSGIISPPWLAWVTVFIGTFLIVFIPLSILSHRLAEIIKRSEIGPIDRALGFVFGIGRGLVIVGLAYIAFAYFVPFENQPMTLTNARLFPLIQNSSEVLLSLVPGAARTDRQDETNTARAGSDAERKTYGAADRGALDRLIETTGRKQGSSQ